MTTLSMPNRHHLQNGLHEVGEWTLLHTGESNGAQWAAALCLSEAEVDILSVGEAWEVVLGSEDGDELLLEVEAGRSGLHWFGDRALATLTAKSSEPHRVPAWAKNSRSIYSLEVRANDRAALAAGSCVRFSQAV